MNACRRLACANADYSDRPHELGAPPKGCREGEYGHGCLPTEDSALGALKQADSALERYDRENREVAECELGESELERHELPAPGVLDYEIDELQAEDSISVEGDCPRRPCAPGGDPRALHGAPRDAPGDVLDDTLCDVPGGALDDNLDDTPDDALDDALEGVQAGARDVARDVVLNALPGVALGNTLGGILGGTLGDALPGALGDVPDNAQHGESNRGPARA